MPHTPGPYSVTVQGGKIDINGHRHLYWAIESEEEGAAIVVTPGERATSAVKAERLATATLLSAAPEMLPALEETLRLVLKYAETEYVRNPGFDVLCGGAINRARAAIAKAKGEVGADPQGKGGRDA